ncbi:MAG: hypothetical protein GWN58_21380, partial [Anaerolineae bacterium]|nr:hypothetical protein [Anaerolineae bacterium]
IGLTAGGRGLQAVARAGEGWEEIAASALDEDPPPSGDGLEGSPEANAEDLIGDWVESHPYHRDYLRVSPRAHRWFPLRAGMRLLGAMVVYAEGEKLSTEEN